MSFLTVKNIALRGISACVPSRVEENTSLPCFAEGEAEKVIKSTGIHRKHVVEPGTTTSDLCVPAAKRLLSELGWREDSVDALVFVSASRDYITPCTACILQDRLGLSESVLALDIPLSCTGWVHGLSVLSSLLAPGGMKRGLLLAGDTNTTMTNPNDKESRPLFGDAGTATALEFEEGTAPFFFTFGTEGKNYEAIIIPDGGYRNPATEESLKPVELAPGVVRRRVDCKMDGMDVFVFSGVRGAQCISDLYSHFDIVQDNVDFFLFHQANRYMTERIRKKLKIDPGKVPYCLQDYGNTSCASIPLTVVTQQSEAYRTRKLASIACAFGVGLCWAGIHFNSENIACPEVVVYD